MKIKRRKGETQINLANCQNPFSFFPTKTSECKPRLKFEIITTIGQKNAFKPGFCASCKVKFIVISFL